MSIRDSLRFYMARCVFNSFYYGTYRIVQDDCLRLILKIGSFRNYAVGKKACSPIVTYSPDSVYNYLGVQSSPRDKLQPGYTPHC